MRHAKKKRMQTIIKKIVTRGDWPVMHAGDRKRKTLMTKIKGQNTEKCENTNKNMTKHKRDNRPKNYNIEKSVGYR